MELSITRAAGFFGSQVAQERDRLDIRVNPVAPEAGAIVTASWNALGLAREAVDEWTEETATEVPLKRFGQPATGSRPSRRSLPRTTLRTSAV